MDAHVYDDFVRLVQEWKERYHSPNRPFLFFAKALSYLTIYDGRGPSPISERFDQPYAFILEYCSDQPKSFAQIRKGLQDQPSTGSEKEIQPLADLLTSLQRKHLLYEEGGRYFTLALPVNPYR